MKTQVGYLLSVALVLGPWSPSGTKLLWAQSTDQEGPGVRTVTVLPRAIYQSASATGPWNRNNPSEISISASSEGKKFAPLQTAILEFDRESLPPDACVTSWTLRLYLKCNAALKSSCSEDQHKATYSQRVRVYPVVFQEVLVPNGVNGETKKISVVAPEATSVASGEIATDADKLEVIKADIPQGKQCAWLDSPGNLGFKVESSSPWVEYRYYGATEHCDSKLCNKQPRLIVHYRDDPDKPRRTAANWPQLRHDPQQTSQTTWRTYPDLQDSINPPPRLNAYYTVKNLDPKLEGITMTGLQSPLIYNDQIILGAQGVGTNNYKNYIAAVRSNGETAWSRPIRAQENFATIDREGLLYVISQNCLYVLSANTGLDPKTGQAPLLQPDKSEVDLCRSLDKLIGLDRFSVQNAPTVGASGTLYLPTAQGFFAMTRYPNLKVLWKSEVSVADDKEIGTPVLDATESTVFVATKAGTLYAIDTTDGATRWTGKLSDSAIGGNVPVPVVGPGMRSRDTFVYVALKGQGLKVFCDCEEIPRKAKADRTTRLNADLSINDPVSQVVLHTDLSDSSSPVTYVYFVKEPKDGTGQVCGLRNDSAEFCAGTKPRFDPASKSFIMGPATGFPLSRLSLLAADGRGNIYILDSENNPQSVLEFTPGEGTDMQLTAGKLYSLANVDKDQAKKSTNFGGDNLLLGPDGTLYNTNGDHLFAIQPKALVDSLSLKKENSATANQTSFLARQTITVESTFKLSSLSNTILEAGQQINFQRGLSVQLGAQLSCRIQSQLK